MKKKQKKKKQAFSLMELLVVVAILGILATVFTFYLASSRKKARDARRKSDVLGTREALEMYYDDHGEYPSESIFPPSNPEDPFEADGIVYMDKVPDDLKEGWDYDYESDGTYYRLYARLENENDDDAAEGVYPDSDCTGSDPSCNYGGTSPNTSLPDPVVEPTPGPTSPPPTPSPTPVPTPPQQCQYPIDFSRVECNGNICLNSASGCDCEAVCQSQGFTGCVSVGTDANASNNSREFYNRFSGCRTGVASDCDLDLPNNGGTECSGIVAEWTYCNCTDLPPTPPPETCDEPATISVQYLNGGWGLTATAITHYMDVRMQVTTSEGDSWAQFEGVVNGWPDYTWTFSTEAHPDTGATFFVNSDVECGTWEPGPTGACGNFPDPCEDDFDCCSFTCLPVINVCL